MTPDLKWYSFCVITYEGLSPQFPQSVPTSPEVKRASMKTLEILSRKGSVWEVRGSWLKVVTYQDHTGLPFVNTSLCQAQVHALRSSFFSFMLQTVRAPSAFNAAINHSVLWILSPSPSNCWRLGWGLPSLHSLPNPAQLSQLLENSS